MGYYFRRGWRPGDNRSAGSLHEWIANEYPDMTSQEINYHILNLALTLEMSTEQLTKYLLEDEHPPEFDGDLGGWIDLDEPPY